MLVKTSRPVRATWMLSTGPKRRTTPQRSPTPMTMTTDSRFMPNTLMTTIPSATPTTTPMRRSKDTLRAENGWSRIATSGATTAKIGTALVSISWQTSQLTTAAMTMRTICGHSAKNRFRSVARSGSRAIAPLPSLLGSTLCWEGIPETRPMVAPMPQREIRFRTTTPVPTHTEVDHQALVTRFAAIRGELKVPADFPPDVEAEAERAARDVALPDRDETDVPFVTVDPVGSMDLDQALHLQRVGDGYRVRYAIADVPAYVTPGGVLDVETHRRVDGLLARPAHTA